MCWDIKSMATVFSAPRGTITSAYFFVGRQNSSKAGFTRVVYWEGRIIIETWDFRSLVENVFVFVCYSTWSRTCSRSLPLSLISLITRLRGSKSTPNNFQAPINHILLCYLASLVWASVSTKSLRWNSPPPQRKTVECCGWKWTRWRWGGDGDWGGWGVI